jgi:hypothetical protein
MATGSASSSAFRFRTGGRRRSTMAQSRGGTQKTRTSALPFFTRAARLAFLS